MYKTKNTGTGNGMQGTWGMRWTLYSGESPQTFRGMSSSITGNVAKHSGECPQTFRGISVLLKEMRTQGQSKISSSCFCVWCKSRELRGSGSPRFPCVTPVMETFPSDLLRAIVSYWAESGVMWFFVCGAPLIGLLLVLLMSFSHMASMVLVLRGVGQNKMVKRSSNLRTKLCCHASGKWNISRVTGIIIF